MPCSSARGSNHNTVTGENIGGDQPAAWIGAGICITGNAAGNVVTGVRVANCAVGIRIDSTVGNNVVTGGYIDPACPVSLAVTAGTGNVIRISYNLATANVAASAVTPLDLTGCGSPEGAVTAPVGSRYQRADGGAGTSFYVKESGTGNTGWAGK